MSRLLHNYKQQEAAFFFENIVFICTLSQELFEYWSLILKYLSQHVAEQHENACTVNSLCWSWWYIKLFGVGTVSLIARVGLPHPLDKGLQLVLEGLHHGLELSLHVGGQRLNLLLQVGGNGLQLLLELTGHGLQLALEVPAGLNVKGQGRIDDKEWSR